jgi:uncharacterized OB-fold protein
MIPTPALHVSRCDSCHSRFLPRPGHCPRCGSDDVHPQEISPEARVLAVTESSTPAPGWPKPHRLALVEAADAVRILVVVDALPKVGSTVFIAAAGDHFVANVPRSDSERG